MFERFSREAKRAVTAAVEEAEQRGDSHIGTDHLLVGLVASIAPGVDLVGASADDLRNAWLAADRAALEATGVEIDLPSEPGPSRRRGHIPFTGGAKQVLMDTLREATALKSRRLEPEHMVIALTLRPPHDPAIRLLDAAGLSADAIRADLIETLRRSA